MDFITHQLVLNLNPVVEWGKCTVFEVQGKAQRRGMRPRRAEQCLPQEGATPKRDAGASLRVERDRGIPALPDPRCAGLLGRRFGAPFHSKELQRSHVPQKLCNSPRSGLTRRVSAK
ncbi:hypothetical protein [Nitrosospira briensis]|uniref:hypothetical protein n=1 Tax=Nitrosospira briensis TaxID=35799 RepID=UPI00046A96FD|nr:hypothetical protein [Nitrosospira briensis]